MTTPTQEGAATYETEYCTRTRADAILTEFGLSWSGSPTDDEKDAALRRAQAYLDGMRWQGVKTNNREQRDEWPRAYAYDRDGNTIDSSVIPREIERACALLAAVEQANPQTLTPQVTLNDLVKSEKVGQLAVTYRDGPSVHGARPVITIVKDTIAPLRRGNPLQMRRA